jgi:hypothetical protein
MFPTKVEEKIETYILYSITSISKIVPYIRMWKQYCKAGQATDDKMAGRPEMTKWRMHIACWIPKDINTFSEYVLLIASPLQQRLHKRASMSQ